MKIFAKIQNGEGILNFLEILSVADGIIVSRLALGISLDVEKIFVA